MKMFKKGTTIFFEKINDIRKKEGKPELTFELLDVPHYDLGDWSVVDFRIKECQGWLFGIWWNEIKDDDEHHYILINWPKAIQGRFFAQYESAIDKFKPSTSEIKSDFYISTQKKNDLDDYHMIQVCRMINFIIEEPALAFCRDYNGWDYNLQFHTREEAQEKFDRYQAWYKNKTKKIEEINEKFIRFAKEKFCPMFNEATVIDYGEDCSPRFQLIAPYSQNKKLVPKAGLYSCFSEEPTEEEKQIELEYDALMKESERISDEFEFVWFPPLDDTVKIVSQASFKTLLQICEEV